MLGVFAVVLCGCVVVALVLGIFAVVFCGCVLVAASVVFDTPLLLLCSVGLVVGFAGAEAPEMTTKKGNKSSISLTGKPSYLSNVTT